MALNDKSVLIVDSGQIYLAPVGTAAPADLRAPGASWKAIGHTSLEDIIKIKSEGGEAKNIGTLQSRALRTTYTTRVDTFGVNLQQFDADSLKLYFGANTAATADARYLGVPTVMSPNLSAVLIVYYDGQKAFSIWCPKAEITRGDDLELSDTESIASLPLTIKPVVYSTNNFAWTISHIGAVGTATGVTAGSPGSFTGGVAPYDEAELKTLIASPTPTTAWTTGQHVILGNSTYAKWTGSAWVTSVDKALLP